VNQTAACAPEADPALAPVLDVVTQNTITPEWITRALGQSGIDAVVDRFEARTIGTGQVGENIRYRLAYTGAVPQNAPATVVGKFSSRDEVSKEGGKRTGTYLREFAFYRLYAHSVGMRVPRTYAVEFDFDTHDFVLLMEDQAPAVQGDQMQGCTLEQARNALSEAAKLHASHWRDPDLDQRSWLSGTRTAPSVLGPDHYRTFWAQFTQRYGDRVDPAARALVDPLMANFERWSETAGNAPRCLVHGDYRPDNMLFRSPRGGATVTIVDWQTVGVGPGAADVAYFLGGALLPDIRKEVEDDLLQHYFDCLSRYGVTDYSLDNLHRDYGKHAFGCALMAIIASALVVRTDRGDEMFLTMFHRSCRLAQDVGTLDFVV